jgi:hypothetical protein
MSPKISKPAQKRVIPRERLELSAFSLLIILKFSSNLLD